MKKLLIVIVIVGLIVFGWASIRGLSSGLFSPAMKDYAIRKEIVSGLKAAKPFKTAIGSRYSSDSNLCASNESCGMKALSTRTYSISIGERGLITVTYTAINPRVDGKTVVLKPHKNSTSLTWDCKGGSIQPVHRPASCR